jgi:hypothetical protein
MSKNKSGMFKILMAAVIVVAGYPAAALAQSTSSNYKVEESYFGSGGQVDSNSANYRARQSTGSLGVGDTSSANYRATSGFDTPSEPFLEVTISGGLVSLGTLSDTTPTVSAAQAGSCNCSFSVRSYLSSDYTVVTASQPPTSENGDVIDSKTTQAIPSTSTGVEEFGMNLVDNSSPNVGSNPVNQPDNSFADGKAASGYEIPNQFKYSLGDIIARSPATIGNQGVGRTDYTITYLAKISRVTPAGNYTMEHVIIVVPSF